VTSLIAALSCRSCRPNAPFAVLVRLSRTSIADEMREEHRRRCLANVRHGHSHVSEPVRSIDSHLSKLFDHQLNIISVAKAVSHVAVSGPVA